VGSTGTGLIYSKDSRHSTIFQNLVVRNMTISSRSTFFKQHNAHEDTKESQTNFKLVNGKIQDLEEINNLSVSPINVGLFIHVEGPTNYIFDNITVNNTVLCSKETFDSLL